MIFILLLLISNFASASEVPCSEFEIYINPSEVQAYTKKDGTQVSEASRKEHCRENYPGTKNWSESFKDTPLDHWSYTEQFKNWVPKEKEIVLKMIAAWPDAFKNWKGVAIHRAKKSQFPKNPGASLPSANAIILYDNFFSLIAETS